MFCVRSDKQMQIPYTVTTVDTLEVDAVVSGFVEIETFAENVRQGADTDGHGGVFLE